MYRKVMIALAVLAFVSGPTRIVHAAPENLDELFARKARLASASWPSNQLENSTTFIWQPETFTYRDTSTGHEIWRLTGARDGYSVYFSDIGQGAWSADGKYVRISSLGRPTQAYDNRRDGVYQGQMIARPNGSSMRFLVDGPSRAVQAANGEFWSPQLADTYYEFGNGWMGATGTGGALYRVKVDDRTETKTQILRYPTAAWSWNFGKLVSPDGRRAIGVGVNVTPDPKFEWYYPTTIYPDSQAKLELDPVRYSHQGYPGYRYLGHYGGTLYPDPNAAWMGHPHDKYAFGDGSFFFWMTQSGATWWRLKTLGTHADGGAFYNNANFPVTDRNHDFGEAWPENHSNTMAYSDSAVSPFVQANPYSAQKTAYWSHFVPDRWGRHALFSNVADGLAKGIGPAVWDIAAHRYVTPSFGGGAQHHDWHGFTDWVVSSGDFDPYPEQSISAAKYNDPSSQLIVNRAYTRYDGGTSYLSLVRPSQSPDGTKVAWHSEFLRGRDSVDAFWSVVVYPYPPTSLSAQHSNGLVLSFVPPRYTDRRWPYAQSRPAKDSRGWPLLDSAGNETGEVLYARELKGYHIWRATAATGPWQEVGQVPAVYSHTYHTSEDPDGSMLMLHPVDNQGRKISDSNKIRFSDNPGNGIWYYAITSEEHSGLESNELSEILQVTLSGTTVSGQIVQSKGQKNFWKLPPPAPNPRSFNFSAGAANRLMWTEPGDSKIRYYNIYYSHSSPPPVDQRYRIASVPAGTTTYLDWLADISKAGYYVVTSVDRHGNESAPASTKRPGAPANFHVAG